MRVLNDAGDSSPPEDDPPPRSAASIPVPLVLGAQWAWRFLVIAGAVYVIVWLFAQVRVAALAVIGAVMVSSMLAPLVNLLQRRGIPRLAATWIVVLAALGALAGIAFGIVPPMIDEIGGLQDQVNEAIDDIKEWAQDGPLDLTEERVDEIEANLRDRARDAADGLLASPSRPISVATEIITGLLLGAALTFFFVKDGEAMWRWIVRRSHPARRDAIWAGGSGAISAVRGWLGGVAISGVIEAVLIGVALLILGVPLVVPLAVIHFFAAFFPIIGATVAGLLAVTVAWLSNGFETAVIMLIVVLAVQQIEGNVLLPVIMGRRVSLHPAVVLIALVAGGALAGIVGAFLAVPVTAAATAAVHEIRSLRDEES